MAQVLPPQLNELEYNPGTHIIGVRFEKLGKLYYFDYSDWPNIQRSDYVIVETVRGIHMGQVIGFAEREPGLYDYKPVLRPASGRDMLLAEQWKKRSLEILIELRAMAADMGDFEAVKWVQAEYNFEGTHLTILYSTEEDVEINPLRESFNKFAGLNAEFRRIGPREVARRLGGQGACGGPRCCSTFLTDFSPISIKMAKAQNIPLNPGEITGMCGRLRCCLIYEYEQYIEARKQLPRRGKTIGTSYGEVKVADVHPIKDGVSVYVENQRHFVPREDIIPLDEFRALQARAAQGCSKNESGSCDCGAYRPKSESADLKEAIEQAHRETSSDEQDDKSGDDKRQKRRRRSTRQFRQKNEDKSPDSTSSTKKQKRRGGKRRGRYNRRNRSNRGNQNRKNEE
jgi:cell fate regulator YaaT (PSP1 superfamily)